MYTNHLQTLHHLAKSQWGFLTVTGLLATSHNWLSILEGGGEIGAVSFDLRKAFDSIPHEVLLEKLEKIGLSNPILVWISDYLTCREQKVMVNGAESQHTTVLSGVPQGSVLGPLQFFGVSLSEPHTSGTALRKCVNVHKYVLAIHRKF